MAYSVASQIGDTTKYAGFVHVGQQVTANKGPEGVQIMIDGIVKELNK